MTGTRAALRRLAAAAALLAASAGGAAASKKIEAVDVDTVHIHAGGPIAIATMRLSGIDGPETNSRCLAERHHAAAGKARLNDLVAGGATPTTEFEFDRYGRFLGRITLRDGRDAAEALIAQNYVRRYDGTGPRRPWCDADGKLTP